MCLKSPNDGWLILVCKLSEVKQAFRFSITVDVYTLKTIELRVVLKFNSEKLELYNTKRNNSACAVPVFKCVIKSNVKILRKPHLY